jgi:hypothetical protein
MTPPIISLTFAKACLCPPYTSILAEPDSVLRVELFDSLYYSLISSLRKSASIGFFSYPFASSSPIKSLSAGML